MVFASVPEQEAGAEKPDGKKICWFINISWRGAVAPVLDRALKRTSFCYRLAIPCVAAGVTQQAKRRGAVPPRLVPPGIFNGRSCDANGGGGAHAAPVERGVSRSSEVVHKRSPGGAEMTYRCFHNK